MPNDTDYGAECSVTDATTGAALGRFRVDTEFRRVRHDLTIAVLSTTSSTGARLRDAGALVLRLDDGRQVSGTVCTILGAETIVALTPEH